MKRAALALIGCMLASSAHALPSFDEILRSGWRSSDWVLLARDGEPLQRTRIDTTERRGDWVALQDVSPALRGGIVVSEDKRFYEHSGVDCRGASAAAWANLWNTRTRGASMATMQLTGLIDEDRRPGRRSIGEKATQTVGTLWLDHDWRKDQILEAYLNFVPFRGEIVGLSALSRTLFGKLPSGMNEREAALTAALVRAPNANYAKVSARPCGILRDMSRARPSNMDPCANLDSYVQLTLTRTSSASPRSSDYDALATPSRALWSNSTRVLISAMCTTARRSSSTTAAARFWRGSARREDCRTHRKLMPLSRPARR